MVPVPILDYVNGIMQHVEIQKFFLGFGPSFRRMQSLNRKINLWDKNLVTRSLVVC
jgi:hypothetical protein